MNPSQEYLQTCSTQTGFQIATLEKVVRLGEMAGDITRHPFLGKVLVRRDVGSKTTSEVVNFEMEEKRGGRPIIMINLRRDNANQGLHL